MPNDLAPSSPRAEAEPASGAGALDAPPFDGGHSIDRSMPSSLASGGPLRSVGPPAGSADPAADLDLATDAADERELSPALRAAKVASELGTTPPAFPDRRPATVMAPTDPFPNWSESSMDSADVGDQTEAMAVPARERLAATSAGRAGDRLALDTPTNLGAHQPASGQRLQDTDLKLAGQRRKQKPKEPNRPLLFLAMALVVLAGVGVAWWLSRDDGAADNVAADGTDDALAPETGGADGVTADADVTVPTDAADPEPIVDEPTLFFEEAQLGPLDRDTTYGIDLAGEAEGSLLQVVVDDIPQGQPDLALPDLILPAGRHTIEIAITNGAEVTNSTPVEVYVLGDPPPAGYIANLASVDMQNEGWAEAIRRFDEFRAAGHESLQMLPLTAGYWNIYVGGLGNDSSGVDGYCEGFQLSVPDQCFPKLFDPATYTPPTPAAPAPADGTTETTTTGATDSMTDQSGEAPSTPTSGG